MNLSTDLRKIYLKELNSKTLRNVVNTHYTDEKSSVLMRADKLMKGIYLFQNEWDMERTQIPVQMDLQTINWNYLPTQDMEWSYMLHRHAYLVDLVLAYIYTDDIKYINHLRSFINKYIEDNSYNDINKAFSYRTIDVGLRLLSWIRVFEMLDILGISYDPIVEEVMSDYCDFLLERINVSRSQSNWVAIECSAIIVYLTRMNIDEGLDQAISIYTLCLENQVLDDGLQWEQSFMYHHEVLITALHVSIALGSKANPLIHKVSRKMAHASKVLTRTNGTQTNFGDSDYEDMNTLLLACEKVLGIELLVGNVKSGLYDFLFSGDFSASTGKLDVPSYESISLDNNGFSWVKDHVRNSTFMFAYGPLGGGHGHDDFLHIDWMVSGQEFLVDSGRYTYHEEKGSRLKYKSPLAHNVPVVDGKSYNEHIDSWSSKRVAQGFGEKRIFMDSVALFEGGHFGYSDDTVTFINRKAIYVKGDVLFIIDSMKSDVERELTSNFVVFEPVLRIEDQSVAYQYDLVDMKFTILSDDIQITKCDHVISPQYNLEKNTERLSVSKRMKNGSIITMVSPSQISEITSLDVYDDNGNKYEKEVVECFKYYDGKTVSYLLIQHKEPDDSRRSYCVEGHYVYGRIVYFEIDNDEIINKQNLY